MDMKFVAITPPAADATGATPTTASLDTKGWDYVTIVAHFGVVGNGAAVTTMKLTESDTDSAYADITVGSATKASFITADATPLSDGSSCVTPTGTAGAGNCDNGFYAWQVNLKGRKRYLDVSIVCAAVSQFITVFAILSRGAEMPNSMSERGLTGEIIV